MYTAPSANYVYPVGVYTHFLKLSVAFNILLDSNAANRTPQMLEYARKFLVDYVSSATQFFGPTFSTYNVHNLLHIVDAFVDDISAFQFENYMQVIKKFVKNAHNPLAQIVKRSEELGHSTPNGPISEIIPALPSQILIKFCQNVVKHVS